MSTHPVQCGWGGCCELEHLGGPTTYSLCLCYYMSVSNRLSTSPLLCPSEMLLRGTGVKVLVLEKQPLTPQGTPTGGMLSPT